MNKDPFDIYAVVMNHEEEYSIWPEQRAVPEGWRLVGKTGSKEECLNHIEEVWTDMRPLSLRRAMADEPAKPADSGSLEEISLVDQLCADRHPVIFTCRPEANAAALKRRLEEFGYISLRLKNTRGGTELGIHVDGAKSNWSAADFGRSKGEVRVVGSLTLDGVALACEAVVDLPTLSGDAVLSRIAG